MNSDERRANRRSRRQQATQTPPPDLFPSGAPPGEEPPDPLDETSVSRDEQAEYTQIIKQAAHVLYNDPKSILATINDPGQPIQAQVGSLVARLGMGIEQKAKASGAKLSPDVMFHASDEVVGMVLDLAIKGKLLKVDPASDEYQRVHGLSMMEAEKAFGERMLASPQKDVLVDQAGNEWMQQVANEVEAGTASPDYTKMAKQQIAQRQGTPVGDGVRAALGGQGG